MKNILKTYKGLPKEIYVLFIGKIVNSLGAFVQPLMSFILTQKLSMSASDAGLFVTMVAVCQVPCIIIGGKLTDTIGRKKVIITCQLFGALTLLICGIIPLSQLTSKLMILSSCFYSISIPAYDALNADLTEEHNRKRAYSLLYMGHNIGYAIGPVLGGFLYKNYLHIAFVGDAITTLLALSLIVFYIKEPLKKIKTKEHCKLYRKEEKSSTFKVIIKRPILILFPIMMFFYNFAYSQWTFTLPIYLIQLFPDNGAKIFGFLGGFNGFLVIAFTPLLTYKTKNFKALNIMTVAGILYGLSFVICIFATQQILFFIVIFILTMGEILIVTNSQPFIANNTPPTHRGRILAIVPMISGTGRALGPYIMGGIIDTKGMFASWIIITVTCFIGAVGMFIIKNLKNVNDVYEKS